jgi:hypothetical protein
MEMEWKRKVYLSACSFLNTYALAQIRYKSQLIILLYDTIWIQIYFAKHICMYSYHYERNIWLLMATHLPPKE